MAVLTDQTSKRVLHPRHPFITSTHLPLPLQPQPLPSLGLPNLVALLFPPFSPAIRPAPQVFDAVAGETVGAPEGRDAWSKCIDVGSKDAKGPIPMLDDELKGQTGGEGGESTVAILPTVRINKKQYRGNLDAGSVLRALCAAFPSGAEPAVCTETWVSEDECAEGGDGWRECNSG